MKLIFTIQFFAVIIHLYWLYQEWKYCRHCDWWWNTGAFINFAITLFPILGIFPAIGGCIDYKRNIQEVLENDSYRS
jgi:hypothetical protein